MYDNIMKRNKFEQRKYNEMRRSLCIEFKYSKKPSIHKILTEAKGMVEGDDEILTAIFKKIQQETNNGEKNARIRITNEDVLPNLTTEPFFENIVVEVDYNQDNEQLLQAEYIPKYNQITPNNKMEGVCIVVVMHGNYRYLIHQLYALISHELLHAYEDYQRTLKTGKGLDIAANETGYMNNKQVLQLAKQTQNNVIEQLSYIYYYSCSFEANAYTNQLKQQMKLFKQSITNADDAMNTLQYTPLYQGYIQIGNTLNYISANMVEYRKDIEEWYTLVYNKKLSAGKIMRRLRNLYNKTWNRMRKSTASYIRTLYEQQ